jgi:uncharacterized protein (TIGR03067 family)
MAALDVFLCRAGPAHVESGVAFTPSSRRLLMRFSTLAAFTLFALAPLTRAQEAKGDPAGKELKKLQGAWALVGLEAGGQKFPEEKVRAVKGKLTVTGHKFTFTGAGKETITGTIILDPTKSPGHVAGSVTNPKGTEGKYVGIYELKGDTFRLCFDPEGKERPTEFRTQAGTRQYLETFRREKPR